MGRPDLGERALIALLLAAIVAYGVALRLEDPLSTRALGAEDPYTHVVFIGEWTRSGSFGDSFHLATPMYPPGMHAFTGAFAPFTGFPVHEFARLAPPILAALGIFGTYALASRLGGSVAGLGAAFVTAILPEHIFRSELFFPTAFDLALLPAWLLAFHLALREHPVAGSILFAGASVPIVLMHPWVVPLFGAPLFLYAVARCANLERPGLALARGAWTLAPAVAFAFAFRWDASDTGFSDFAAHLPGLGWIADTTPHPLLIFTVTLLSIGAGIAFTALLLEGVRRVPLPGSAGLVARLGAGAGLLALLPMLTRELPRDVVYAHMLGEIAIALGLAGFALAFARPTPLGQLGACLAIILFPLTALDPFNSPFWPQRTVAYLAVAVGLLGGNALAHTADLARWALKAVRPAATAGPAILIVLAIVATGSVVAKPVDTYRWYRMYDEDDLRAFERVAERVAGDPSARVFVHGWQPGLILKALEDPAHVWFSPKFFQDDATRERQLEKAHGPTFVVIEKHTRRAEDAGKVDLGFLGGARFRLVDFSEDGGVAVYQVVR